MIQAERNYSTTEREGLAVVFSLKKFRHYLLGGKFTIVTDHKALKYIFTQLNVEGRMVRWKILMSEYDFTICDRPCKKHANADLLSRAYEDMGDEPVDETFPDEDLMVLTAETEVPMEYQEIWNLLQDGTYPEGMRSREKQALLRRSKMYKIEALKILEVGYHWNDIFKDCLDYCKTCDVCQSFATKSNVPTPLRSVPPLGPFEKWGIDCVGPLNRTLRNHKYIVVATDYLTKWVETRPLAAIGEVDVGRCLYELVITRFGCPLEFVSGRGGEFVGGMITAMCEHFSITQRITTSYTPRSNGLVEMTNFTLCQLLAKDADMEGARHNWDKRLHGILWEYRTTPKTSTGFSPFMMVYGVESKLPIQFDLVTFQTLHHRKKHVEGRIAERERGDELMALQEDQEVAAQRILGAQARQKKYYDKKITKELKRFKEANGSCCGMRFDTSVHKRSFFLGTLVRISSPKYEGMTHMI
ncbi:hypothetical protein R1sor_006879 [Riccia sorocarpa]|uniref:Integrase catalytic domain-containing protein n=1 Tax=Riccia sorocarpa TaxID=122646 RepID=A0ABD3HNN9_9MARC